MTDSLIIGRGTPTGTNTPSGGHVVARRITAKTAFTLTKVAFRYNSINGSGGTTKFRAAVYDHGETTHNPKNLLGQSQEFQIAADASPNDYTFTLDTPVSISKGQTYYVAVFQSDNTHLAMVTDGSTGNRAIGFYETGTPGNTTPDNPWVGSNQVGSTPWMVWAIGNTPSSSIQQGRGGNDSTNSPGGGHAIARKITAAIPFTLTGVGFRYASINQSSGTTKFRAAVYDDSGGNPHNLITNSAEFQIASDSSPNDYLFTLNASQSISAGQTFYVAIFQSDNSHLTMDVDKGEGDSAANGTGYYETGTATTTPDNPWVGTNQIATPWMIWAEGTDATASDTGDIGTITFTGQDATQNTNNPDSTDFATITFTGQGATDHFGYTETATLATVTYTGQAATETLHDVVVLATVTFSGQGSHETISEPVALGSITFTGQSVTQTITAGDTGAFGSITITGQVATEIALIYDTGTFATITLTGQTGAYDVSGQVNFGDYAAITINGQGATESFSGFSGSPIPQVTQEMVLVLADGNNTKPRVSQEFVMVLADGDVRPRVTQMAVLVLASVRSKALSANEGTQIVVNN